MENALQAALNLLGLSAMLSGIVFFLFYVVLFFKSFVELPEPSDPREFPSNWISAMLTGSAHGPLRRRMSFVGAWFFSSLILAGIVWLLLTVAF
jgi:hypothetical protein